MQKDHLNNQGSCREVLKIALPLILSTSAFTIQLFIDRVFLMWYDRDAMAAAMLGGILNFVVFSLFMGTANYANTFVSQYDGAGRQDKIGSSVWQSLYFSLIASFVMVGISFFSEPLMNLVGHDIALRQYESDYFRILAIGAMPGLITASLSCFYTGRGKTLTVMWVNIIRTFVNAALDYVLIFGKFSFPQMGASGAALATVCSGIAACGIYIVIFLSKQNRLNFNTACGKFDLELFKRLMRYGLPNGVQFMLEILGFSLFIIFIGRIDTVSLAATSIACQINTLSFMPMVGFGIATSTLVGRALGQNNPQLAQKSTLSASKLTFGYMAVIAVCYLIIPEVFLLPYKYQADAAQMTVLIPLIKNLLIFVAFYCLFDTGNIIFSAAIKGAGDTKFVMCVSIILNWFIVVIPTYLSVKFLLGNWRLYGAWFALTSYVCILSTIFLIRFAGGKWKSMRVIEQHMPVIDGIAAVPTIETEA